MLKLIDHGKVREIRLDRPPANAINSAMIEELTRQLENAGQSAQAVVISGLPGMFSAGLDVPALLQLDRQALMHFWQQFLTLLKTIGTLPVPTAFALTGHAPAGGIVMALFSDYRVMAGGSFKTGLNEVQVGLVVSPVINYALVRLIGRHPAEKILVPGALLSAQEALEIGLVDELETDPESTVSRAVAWCEHLLSLPPAAMTLTRQMSRADLHAALNEPISDSLTSFADLWFSEHTQSTLHELMARLKKK